MEFAFILPVKKISQALFIIKSDNEFSSKSQNLYAYILIMNMKDLACTWNLALWIIVRLWPWWNQTRAVLWFYLISDDCFMHRLLKALFLDSVGETSIDFFFSDAWPGFFRCHSNLLKYFLMYTIIPIDNSVCLGDTKAQWFSGSTHRTQQSCCTRAFSLLQRKHAD